ncbi:MAG: hypothetical protein D3916_17905 [Candidatus Electrothrix sp. MAN1_4]|nr:hypothetical protein [Candidatus Electrothrix sp. MAN1_4]
MPSKRKLSFSKITFEDLLKLVDIQEVIDYSVFEDWFSFEYSLSREEAIFLEDLLARNLRFLDTYLEEELKAQFIIPLLNKVDFFHGQARGWYERPLQARINHVLLHGRTDYMVARGIETPGKPYFFIQEYKQELGDRHPKNALLAEMLVALELNKGIQMRGAYVIGKSWTFMLLNKEGENRYEYFRSQDFSAIKLPELQGIYRNLQAVKAML